MPRDLTHYDMLYRGVTLHLFSKKWFGISAVAFTVRGQRRYAGVVGYPWDMMLMKKRKVRESGDLVPPHLAAVESNVLSRHFPLVAHCAETRYDDGTARTPGWWTVKTMGSAWVLEVKDPDTCCRLVVVQQTVDDALTLASLLLESEEAPWEPDPWLTAARAKKKK